MSSSCTNLKWDSLSIKRNLKLKRWSPLTYPCLTFQRLVRHKHCNGVKDQDRHFSIATLRWTEDLRLMLELPYHLKPEALCKRRTERKSLRIFILRYQSIIFYTHDQSWSCQQWLTGSRAITSAKAANEAFSLFLQMVSRANNFTLSHVCTIRQWRFFFSFTTFQWSKSKWQACTKPLFCTLSLSQKLIIIDQENYMWSTGLLGDNTPEKLVNTLPYLIGVHFTLRAVEEHKALKVGA